MILPAIHKNASLTEATVSLRAQVHANFLKPSQYNNNHCIRVIPITNCLFINEY